MLQTHLLPNANAGDFQTTDGRFQSTTVSTDENTAYPSAWPADGGSPSNYWYSFYLSWQVDPCVDPDASTITIPAAQTAQGDPYDADIMYSSTGDVGNFEYKVTTAGSAQQLNWGKTNMGVSTTNANWTRVSNGNAPSSAGMKLKSVSIYVGNNHADEVRVAVYSGGSLTTGPEGATLLYDFGRTTAGGTNQWLTLTNTGPDVIVPADDPVWIAFKSDSDGNGIDVRYSTSAAGTDYQTARGRWHSLSVNNDDDIAYPAAWPADGSGYFRNYWYSTYITYEASGTSVCTPWTSNATIPASTLDGSVCGDYTDGGTYTLDVRGTDPDCGDIITTTEEDFTWLACFANTTNDLSYTNLESYEVSLTWSFECTNNEYYKVYRDGSYLADVNPCAGTYTDTTVSADTDYSYTVRGYSTDEPCESGDSNTLNIHTPVYEARTTPGIAAAAPGDTKIYISARYTGDSNRNNTLLIEWGYDTVNFSLGSAALPNGQTPYFYEIPGLTNGTAYQIKVTYQDSDGFLGGNSEIQIITHVVPAVWTDDSMLHNSNRFPTGDYWSDEGGWGIPSGQYGGFTCETCHEMNTANIKRVKESISAPAGGFPGADVVFQQVGVAGAWGDDTSTHTTSQAVCEVCHSKTLYHRFNSPTARLHESEPAMYDCTLCHPHNIGFRPDGACTICHAIPMGDRKAVMSEFNSDSHHIQGVTVDGTHCYECHWEANSDGSVNTTYHGGSLDPSSEVDLVIYGSGTRPANYAVGSTVVRYMADGSRTQIQEMNQHCISCHNDANNNAVPFGDGNTPNEYAWDGTCSNPTYNYRRDDCLANSGVWTKGTSINARYAPETTTPWGKYSGANTNGKDAMTKAHSSHGVAAANEQGYDLAEGWPDTSGYTNVACFDCHNSHGSDVAGTTTSYNSDTTLGGNLKSTMAGQGGYQMTYKPAAGGSAGENNVHNAGADLCFDCHETDEANTTPSFTPWGYQGTYGATEPILGYYDTPYFGASSALNTTPTMTINGLCTPCHDPHGISPTLNQDFAVPMLKGTWLTSPYREDAAPSDWNEHRGGGKDRGYLTLGSRPGYYIDQNTFDAGTIEGKKNHTQWDFNATAKITDHAQVTDVNDFAGLCIRCHPQSEIDPADGNPDTWKTYQRIHDSVMGWARTTGANANNTMHGYPCSKCHTAHRSSLPRLMITNCLQNEHRGQQGSGGETLDNEDGQVGGEGGGRGRFPAGGGGYVQKTDDQGIAFYDQTPSAYYFGNEGASGNSSDWQPNYRTCHDNETGTYEEQEWNNVTPWIN